MIERIKRTKRKKTYKEYEWMKKLNTHTRGNGYNYKDRVMVERKKKLPLKTGIPTVRKEESR